MTTVLQSPYANSGTDMAMLLGAGGLAVLGTEWSTATGMLLHYLPTHILRQMPTRLLRYLPTSVLDSGRY
eukprot:788388-Rhodomonas_salina.5